MFSLIILFSLVNLSLITYNKNSISYYLELIVDNLYNIVLYILLMNIMWLIINLNSTK